MDKYKLALALSGGGARGLAHIGVLEALEEMGVKIDLIVGTSFGALIGALFALKGTSKDLFIEAKNYLSTPVFQDLNLGRFALEKNNTHLLPKVWGTIREKIYLSRSIIGKSMIKEENYIPLFQHIFKQLEFKDLKIPLLVTAVDIIARKEVVMTSGSLATATAATCAMPGMFPPVGLKGMLLMDGGVVEKVPIEAALYHGAKHILGVDVTDPSGPQREISSGAEIALRANSVAGMKLYNLELSLADCTITPDLERMQWNEFGQIEFARMRGREAVYTKRKNIKHLLSFFARFKRSKFSKEYLKRIATFVEII